MIKICTKCKKEKSNFYRRKLKHSVGYKSSCKDCDKLLSLKYIKSNLNIDKTKWLKSGPPQNKYFDKIIKLRIEKYSYDAISILLNMPKGTIASICQNNNLGGRIKDVSVPKVQ